MEKMPVIFHRRSHLNKDTNRKGEIRMKINVISNESTVILYLAAEAFWIDWGDGTTDQDMIHEYDFAGIYEIFISGSAINELEISHNSVQELDISGCPWLEYLNCSSNHLHQLDISGCPWLFSLDCSHNYLERLTFGQHEHLFQLYCYYNSLKTLDFSGLPGLLYFLGNHCEFERLDFTPCLRLWCADIGVNEFTLDSLSRTLRTLPIYHLKIGARVMCDYNENYTLLDTTSLHERGWQLE